MTAFRPLLIATAAAAALASGARADGGPFPGVLHGWDGVVPPGGSVRYVTLPSGRRTLVAAVSRRSGRVVRFRSLRGAYGIPLVAFDGTAAGVTRDGRRLVLASSSSPGRTRFALVSTQTLKISRLVTLRGAYSFDALSPNARMLYLVQQLGATPQARYRVRAFDLAAGRLLPRPVSDPKTGSAPMSGYPAARVESREGRWVYTLYREGRDEAFVHALDTVRRVAVCVGLPRAGTRLALRGRTLLVLGRGGTVARIDTQTLRLLR